jgi:ABC-type branched-subunit amino acid transport system ATPase component
MQMAQLTDGRERTRSLLSVSHLSVRYGGVTAVNDVSMDVAQGSFTGLIGPNGAGKTTLIDALSGYARCEGSVTFNGQKIDRLPPHRRQRGGLARTFQSLELFDDLTVKENLQVGESPSLRGVLGEVLRSRPRPLSDHLVELLGVFELGDVADRLVTELSQGQRRLVTVARALASRPMMLLLDEPAAGLDSSESAWLGQKLANVGAAGTTVFLIDHDMALVLEVCQIVHVMNFGSLIASGSPDEIRTNPAVVAAYLGDTHSADWASS